MWTWDGNTDQLSLDPVCKSFFDIGWDEETPQELLEQKLHPDDVAIYQQGVADCVKTGKFASEFRVLKSDGQYRYLSGRGHMVSDKLSKPVIKGVFIDVTATKQLESNLVATRARMQDMVDGIPGLFSYIDRNYKVLFMSAQYRDIFERSNEELVGVHIADLLGKEMFDERKPRYDDALAGEVVHSESSRAMPDGTTAYFAVTHQPHIENGIIQGVITLGIDITDRRRMEEHLEAKSAELARSNKDLEQFAYVASHDLKAPLRAVEVIIEWLREDLEEYQEGDVQENLTLLGQRTSRLARLLDDLLAYSRAGRKVGDVRHVHLDEFVKDIATLVGPPEGMRITTSEGWPCLTTHHAALETVLRNLINNAIKHHPDPGTGRIDVSCDEQGDQVLISVGDDGAGIPAEYADKVFKMFQTLKPRDDTEGSGMGLAIVQRIIDWQGGRIWFENQPGGQGVIFRFTWNKSPQDMPSDEADAAAPAKEHKQDHDHAHGHSHAQSASMTDKDDEDERATDETCENIAG
jgi:PAS domain S-box-containing protein